RAMRFGMFIHWGPISLRGTEIGWSRGNQVPFEEYDQLYQEFNPVLFDASAWVRAAKGAGMKYIILVTKHHDGFALWDSQFSDYDIMAGPFKRDVVRELADECARQGLLFGTYYSILDWYHPDYPVKLQQQNKQIVKENAAMSRYIIMMKGQLTELVKSYGTRILWFDGEWEEPWTHEMGMDLYAFLRGLDWTLLINNRIDKGREGMDGFSRGAQYAGDFETPEQRVGEFNILTPWETNMTICQQWAWKPNDTLKTTRECIHTLLQTVGRDGNFLLNISPMLDGRIEQRQLDRLHEIGEWLSTYGETVYGTRGGPIPPQEWGVTTHKGKTVYLHILHRPDGSIILPNVRIVNAETYPDGRSIVVTYKAAGSEIKVPEDQADATDWVIKAEME
ncbi:MAG: alpha-L-fucosidase, partial [Calditrichaeota bacterium]